MSVKKAKRKTNAAVSVTTARYEVVHSGIVQLLEAGRHAAVRQVNAVMTATYWEIGRRIVEAEQSGRRRANYGDELMKRLALDLSARFGRGFGWRNLFQMRSFYLAWQGILQTPSATSTTKAAGKKLQTVSAKSLDLAMIAERLPLPWSAYVRLLSVKGKAAREFYEAEALRTGWSVRQLDRQISTSFYERTALSRNKVAMLRKGGVAHPADSVSADEAVKDPYVLEFLNLKDEYSENDLEAALIHRLEDFLLELGGDFAFVGRQRRLRVGDQWYRVDLLFFHRRLKALVVIDLKVGKFTHADAGQMHLYLNYAREHWTHDGENPPVGLILCAEKNSAVAHYALEGLPNKVLAAEYKLVLPDEKRIADVLAKTQALIEGIPKSKRRGET